MLIWLAGLMLTGAGAVADDPGERRTDFELRLRNFELEDVEFSIDRALFANGDDDDEVDLDRDSIGIRVRTGNTTTGVFFGAFLERLDLDGPRFTAGAVTRRLDDDVEAFGAEVGGSGVYHFESQGDFTPILDYELSASIRFGDGDGVIDSLWMFEGLGHFGGGIDVRGFQGTMGLAGSTVLGGFDLDPGAGDFIEGNSLGGYVRVGYGGGEAPVVASLQALFGDIHGMILNFGMRF